MINIFKEKAGGQIEYYGLWDWWIEEFTKEERNLIVSTYNPISLSGEISSGESLIKGKFSQSGTIMNLSGEILSKDSLASSLLSSLAEWFKNEDQRTIAYRMVGKAEELSEDIPVNEKHWLYQKKIQIYYRFRDIDDFAMDKAIEGCEQQINIAKDMVKYFKEQYPEEELPNPIGYKQLAIIREKEGNIKEAIKVCEQALREGWSGDWKKRIDKLNKKKN